MNAFELHAIKEKWKKEAEYCLVMAVTYNLMNYPPEVQEVIRQEFQKRDLIKQHGKWQVGRMSGFIRSGVPQ